MAGLLLWTLYKFVRGRVATKWIHQARYQGEKKPDRGERQKNKSPLYPPKSKTNVVSSTITAGDVSAGGGGGGSGGGSGGGGSSSSSSAAARRMLLSAEGPVVR